MQVLEYGGYNAEYGSPFAHSSFLDFIPSWSQFVSGTTPFLVPSDENIVIVS